MKDSGNLRIDYFSDLDQGEKFHVREEINNIIRNTDSLVTIAHNIELLSVLSSSFGYQNDIVLIRENLSLEGFMPVNIIGNRAVSIPHFSYGGYLGFKEITFEQTEFLLTSLREKYGDNFLIRDFKPITKNYYDEKVSCFLELENDFDKQFNRFSSKLRSQIRKAKKNGLSVNISKLEDFYPIYLDNMHRLGSPHLPKEFFNEIIRKYKNGGVEVFVVKKNSKVIATSMVVSFNNFLEVVWAASYKEFNHLAPNMLLYWEMIKYSIENNMKIFSFGRATKDSSSLRFKKQWGPEEIRLVWNYGRPKSFRIESFTFLTQIWRNLPRFFIEKLGPLISKYVY